MTRPKRNRQIYGVSLTSIISFKELIESGQDITEANYVYSLLKLSKNPINSRELSKQTGIERTNITRTLYDLMKINKIKVDSLAKCPVTNKTVQYYTAND